MAARGLAPAPPESGLVPIPGDPGLPLIGYSWQLMHDPLSIGRRRYDTYGPVSWLNAFGTRMVALLGPDAAEAALANRDRAFSNGEGWGYFIGPFFRRGIMLLDFDEHLRHRRIMQQAFTPARLSGYLTAMNPSIATGLEMWRPGTGFCVYPAVKQLTLDLATDIFMGGAQFGGRTDAARTEQINRAFINCVRAGTAYVRTSVPGGRWRRGLVGRRTLEDFLGEHLRSVRDRHSDDLFAALCHAESEDGQRFTDADVVNHMIFLLMAAHDTTTITITTIAEYLGRYPQWQQRCRAESLALGTPRPGYADLDALTSLDLVMKEALRLVAPVPALARRTVADTEVLGHFLPAGTMASVGVHFTHHMAEYWPDPERFDPERFAEHRREDRVHRFAWVPFGGGVHKCIGLHFAGLQVKAVLHQLLLRYRWSTASGYQAPWDYTALPVPKDGLPVRLERL